MIQNLDHGPISPWVPTGLSGLSVPRGAGASTPHLTVLSGTWAPPAQSCMPGAWRLVSSAQAGSPIEISFWGIRGGARSAASLN